MFRLKGVEEEFFRSVQNEDVETATFILRKMMSIGARIEVKTDEGAESSIKAVAPPVLAPALEPPAVPKAPPIVNQVEDKNIIANSLSELGITSDWSLIVSIAQEHSTMESAESALRTKLGIP